MPKDASVGTTPPSTDFWEGLNEVPPTGSGSTFGPRNHIKRTSSDGKLCGGGTGKRKHSTTKVAHGVLLLATANNQLRHYISYIHSQQGVCSCKGPHYYGIYLHGLLQSLCL